MEVSKWVKNKMNVPETREQHVNEKSSKFIYILHIWIATFI